MKTSRGVRNPRSLVRDGPTVGVRGVRHRLDGGVAGLPNASAQRSVVVWLNVNILRVNLQLPPTQRIFCC